MPPLCRAGSAARRRLQDVIATFSSRGPGVTIPGVTRQQPHITGPGVSTLSSYSGTDTQYAQASGTSMSCPHVAGFVALLLSTIVVDWCFDWKYFFHQWVMLNAE